MSKPLRIGNCSAYYGDRLSAMDDMLTGGQLDVLTGDYLAELTMLILGKDKARNPDGGYAKTFLTQMENNMGLALDRGVRIVVNAGGLNPHGLAEALHKVAAKLGLAPGIGVVSGDDVLDRAAELGVENPVTANAYLGGWGIAHCLRSGAQIVVTGRVTDASLVVGAAAWHHGWQHDDLDALAGAVVAGHIIECGTQATGGNYAFFDEIPQLIRPGYPIAEVAADGSCVITKHPHTDGAVTVETVTAQLLYEIGDARYPGPDVTTRLDSIRLAQAGPDRVQVSGVVGEPPPPTYKVCINQIGGFRNEMTFVLTGLNIPAKAELIKAQFAASLRTQPENLRWTLARTDHEDADTEEAASALLHLVARDSDQKVVGRALSNAAIENALASIPGFNTFAPPGDASPYGILVSAYLPADSIAHVATAPDGTLSDIPAAIRTQDLQPVPEGPVSVRSLLGPTSRAPLGRVIGARSGDKGGSANVGVWTRSAIAYPWLADFLTVERLHALLPETAPLPVRRQLLPSFNAINFV
ncbi:MAG: acyclic terpene utilization AtuA family protein, partial [Antricoccus sp.]